jgi:hypothetical protein
VRGEGESLSVLNWQDPCRRRRKKKKKKKKKTK